MQHRDDVDTIVPRDIQHGKGKRLGIMRRASRQIRAARQGFSAITDHTRSIFGEEAVAEPLQPPLIPTESLSQTASASG